MNSELLARASSRIKTLTVLKCIGNYDEALSTIIDLQPDVVVVGLHFGNAPPYKGLDLVRRLRAASAKSRCVLLMDEGEREG